MDSYDLAKLENILEMAELNLNLIDIMEDMQETKLVCTVVTKKVEAKLNPVVMVFKKVN